MERLKIFENFLSFIIAGALIALLLSLFALFSYIIVWGVIIGSIFWVLATVKAFLFSNTSTKIEVIKKSGGRIIEHDDRK